MKSDQSPTDKVDVLPTCFFLFFLFFFFPFIFIISDRGLLTEKVNLVLEYPYGSSLNHGSAGQIRIREGKLSHSYPKQDNLAESD